MGGGKSPLWRWQPSCSQPRPRSQQSPFFFAFKGTSGQPEVSWSWRGEKQSRYLVGCAGGRVLWHHNKKNHILAQQMPWWRCPGNPTYRHSNIAAIHGKHSLRSFLQYCFLEGNYEKFSWRFLDEKVTWGQIKQVQYIPTLISLPNIADRNFPLSLPWCAIHFNPFLWPTLAFSNNVVNYSKSWRNT